MRRTEEQQRLLVDYIRSRYTYDAERGVVRNRKNQVVKGAVNSVGYLLFDARVDGNRHDIKLHQLVWVLVYGRFPKQIDHINGNPKDNRVENLREVNQSENDMNRVWAWKPNAKTGLPGVCKAKGSYRVKVQGKELTSRDKFEAFHTLTMLGRMFKED